jgi:hypothetical protein
MDTKDIKKVFLSAGKKTDGIKFQDFGQQALVEGINVVPIIGDNSWVHPKNHLKASAVVVAIAEKYIEIHFDIEPQAIKATKEEKANNVSHYIELLNLVRSIVPEQFISVAVPFHWQAETYTKLGKLADKLYIMAYGTNKVETIIRRINSILKVLPVNKISVVLNVVDFENEWAMETAIKKIRMSTGVTEFTFHNVDTFIKQLSQ